MTVSVVLASRHPLPAMAAAIDRLLPQCRRVGAQLIIARTGALPDHIPEGCLLVSCRNGAATPQVRAEGLAAARGEWILLTEDNCLVRPDWVDHLVTAADDSVDVAGGVMELRRTSRAIDAAAGVAEYSAYGPCRAQRELLPALACANVAYHRRVVADVIAWSASGQWEDEIHARLSRRGTRFLLVRDAVAEPSLQHRMIDFCRDRYRHGRDYAQVRSAVLTQRSRLGRAAASPLLPPLLSWRAWKTVGRTAPQEFARALPFVLVFFSAWSAGEAVGYVRGSEAA